jgi:hypothetical protein
MILSWIENLILLIAGSPGEPVSETLIALRVGPGGVCGCRALWTGAPPGRKSGVLDLAVRSLWSPARR